MQVFDAGKFKNHQKPSNKEKCTTQLWREGSKPLTGREGGEARAYLTSGSHSMFVKRAKRPQKSRIKTNCMRDKATTSEMQHWCQKRETEKPHAICM